MHAARASTRSFYPSTTSHIFPSFLANNHSIHNPKLQSLIHTYSDVVGDKRGCGCVPGIMGGVCNYIGVAPVVHVCMTRGFYPRCLGLAIAAAAAVGASGNGDGMG